MDFKKTTLLAFIGSLFLMLTASIIWTISGIINDVGYKLFDLIPSSLISLLSLIGEIFIVMFFYSLYKKQK